MRRFRTIGVAALYLFVAASVSSLWASQAGPQTPRLRGTIKDPSGAVMQSVDIAVLKGATVIKATKSDASATLAKESQGAPDPAKLKQLERDTLTKVVGILVPAQRTALLAYLRAQE